jgi:hypothetical protein
MTKTCPPCLAAVLLLSASTAWPAAPGACTDPEYRRLDFWVGDWDAHEADDLSKIVARARIDVVLGGCALHERYEQNDGLVGESFSIYDASRKLWHQSWVTNKGQLLQLDGRFEGDALTLEARPASPSGPASLLRAVWKPQANGVRETAQTSTDAGATWKPLFDIVFQPHKTGDQGPQR